jgi:hypothetical protein
MAVLTRRETWAVWLLFSIPMAAVTVLLVYGSAEVGPGWRSPFFWAWLALVFWMARAINRRRTAL